MARHIDWGRKRREGETLEDEAIPLPPKNLEEKGPKQLWWRKVEDMRDGACCRGGGYGRRERVEASLFPHLPS